MNIRIDTEFEALIPPLTADEFSGLEESIKAEGCRDALVTWGDSPPNLLTTTSNTVDM